MLAPTPPTMSMIVIEAGKSERGYWRDLWRFRELFFFLSWRDILVRYKQTVIGVLWAVIRPVVAMVIFTFVFSKAANVHSDGLPYAVMVFVAMLPWTLFSSSMSEASNSLITNANMLSKIYFPRLIMPASAVIVSFVDFLIQLIILVALLVLYHVLPGWQIITLPFFTLLAFFASVGVSLWLSALNVKYRDFRYVIPFIVQFGLYATPVPYPSQIVAEKIGPWGAALFQLNPLVGVINGFRWAIGAPLGVPMDWTSVTTSIGVVGLVMVTGLRYFRATEKSFADII